jgi:hypothetical protein
MMFSARFLNASNAPVSHINAGGASVPASTMFAVRAVMRRRHRRVLLQNASVATEVALVVPVVEATSIAPAMVAVESGAVISPADVSASVFPATAVMEPLERESAVVVVAVDESDALSAIDALPVEAPLRPYEAVGESASGDAVTAPAKVKKRGRKPQKSDSASTGRRRSPRKPIGIAGDAAAAIPAMVESEK